MFILYFIVFIFFALSSAYLIFEQKRGNSVKNKMKILVSIFIVLILFVNSFVIIRTGYTGVRATFGQIDNSSLRSGFNFKIPFVQSIAIVNNKQQDIKFSEEIWGESSEKTVVYAREVTVTYQINPDKSAWIFANVSNYTDNIIPTELVASAIKSGMVELSTDEVTNRSKIEPLVKEKIIHSLVEKYGEGTISILKVTINNMDFEDSYNQAIANKQIAKQEYEKQQIENKKIIEKAEAEAKSQLITAEAQANAEVIKAKASAEANDLMNKSLTEFILKQKMYEKWNGQLPKVISDGNSLFSFGEIEDKNQ